MLNQQDVQCVEVVLGYVIGGGDYNSVKLLKVKEVDLIADGPGLQVCFQTLFGPCCRIARRMSAVAAFLASA
jgi:hypothetical protein